MAPIASTVALSHVGDISDSARERELYKYYQPIAPTNVESSSPTQENSEHASTPEEPNVTSNIASSKISSPDTALTAFCQYSNTQHFIAESTKTLDLVDNTIHANGDELWMGCGSVSKAGRLCERTIEVPPREGDYPCFIVKGVEEHRRGMKMSRGLASFVEGRSELAEAETEVDTPEGTKIAGSFETDTAIARSKSKSGSIHESTSSTRGSVSSVERKHKVEEYSSALAKAEEAILVSHGRSNSQISRPELEEHSHPNSFAGTSVTLESPNLDAPEATSGEDLSEASSIKVLFSRASNLIREAFEVDGGAIFYDAQRGFGDSQLQQKPDSTAQSLHEDSHTSGDDLQPSGEFHDDQGEDTSPLEASPGSSKGRLGPGLGEGMFTRSSEESEKIVEILGFSTAEASSIHGDEYPGPQSFAPFDEKSLHKLLRRYPRGKLWTFDSAKLTPGSEGACSSSSDEEQRKPLQKNESRTTKDAKRRKVRAKSDAKFLSRHFPGLRQLLFVPLWDASRSRWLSGCFIWSTEITRVLTRQSELAFVIAFCNSVMAECSRIDTEIADQKKSDFIGSISHELRSPLHGILASAEFLGEEVKTGFEKGLVETIDSCGRTLLDTINHILDFSKINHFEQNWRKNKREIRPFPRSSKSIQGVRPSDLPMINLFADVDVSIVCEEVLEGVFAGHVFQHQTAQSFDMVPDSRGKMSDNAPIGPEKPSNTEVAVILDVNMQNYHFTTQPGAFRRVIMNLLGNALKYTSHGYVRVSLEATEIDDLQLPGGERIPRSMVTVTITDTGKGISAEFLRTKLFTPFAQENSLSSGTGLGLSIVKSIVRLLEGDLIIDSELGRGTQAKVMIPLLRDMPKTADSNASSTPKSTTSIPREADESVSLLRARTLGQRVSLHGFDFDTEDPVIHRTGKLLQASVTNFLTNWYGLNVVPFGQRAAIIVLNEASPAMVSKILKQSSINGKTPAILVLCSHSSRFQRSSSVSDPSANVGFVAKPVGPLKLARALTQCLEGATLVTTPGLLEKSSSESNDLSSVFEEMSLSPHSGELLDNSRMAADSDNARKAIESPTPNATVDKHQEFPFPIGDERPSVPKSTSMPGDKESLQPLKGSTVRFGASAMLSQMETTSTSVSDSGMAGIAGTTPALSTQPYLATIRSPRLLLVDDNAINLGLLRAFMVKRKYRVVELAENGLQAVQKFEQKEDGFDIIFMDISMPVLNGFDATKEIRRIEENRRQKALEGAGGGAEPIQVMPSALIIALTGLASSRDQAEAASVGIDVFLTKPVAFREVGKMMDNWQANRERDSRGSEGSS
ncbi:Autoinducer 2 sensor kinase phosphatase [Hyphodiscus hymeniophilus]|uniref:histidine kinase n=1 Tax=Hyphodiscus hymeniophilus TaxID=353542 RepID=A0A9P6VIU3_9HELO|nr:Autoinducer 2 sensor kinase phosphatase [Hyphodiscus hymeniophilus]